MYTMELLLVRQLRLANQAWNQSCLKELHGRRKAGRADDRFDTAGRKDGHIPGVVRAHALQRLRPQPARNTAEELDARIFLQDELRHEEAGGSLVSLSRRERFHVSHVKITAGLEPFVLRALATDLQHSARWVHRRDRQSGKTPAR
jgi:hypothetical protein